MSEKTQIDAFSELVRAVSAAGTPGSVEDVEAMYAIIAKIAVDEYKKIEADKLDAYEKRTMVIERLAMALEHYNEQKFHTT